MSSKASISLRQSLNVVAMVAFMVMGSRASAVVRYVNVALNTGRNDGSSWANAHQGPTGISHAIAVAASGDQIWVAKGRYKTNLTGDRSASIILKTGVATYGGFAGDETLLGQRNVAANVTIITGDLNDDDDGTPEKLLDNSRQLINGSSSGDITTILDGFTITAGNADDVLSNDRGAALLIHFASPAFRKCKFIGNRSVSAGGAAYLFASSPLFEDCIFSDNSGGQTGGAVHAEGAPDFKRCRFINNSASRGGALYMAGNINWCVVDNCLFTNNSATGLSGGAIYSFSQDLRLTSCTIGGNIGSPLGSAIYAQSTAAVLTNTIVWGNTGGSSQLGGSPYTVSWSCIQGGHAGTGNISANPMFVDIAGGDLHLGPGSGAIDAGSNSAIGSNIDCEGLPRRADDTFTPDTGLGVAPIIDMGAHEVQIGDWPPPPNNNCAASTIVVAGWHPYTTNGATTDGFDEPALCDFNGSTQINNDIWFRYVAQCTDLATISLCGATFNAKLAVYSSACPSSPGAVIACNDDTCGTAPQVTIPVVSGTVYRVRIGGVGEAEGTGTMVITCGRVLPCPADIVPPPVGNGIVNVQDLLAVIGAWGRCGDPNHCPADLAPPGGDELVNVQDLLAVIGAWGACP